MLKLLFLLSMALRVLEHASGATASTLSSSSLVLSLGNFMVLFGLDMFIRHSYHFNCLVLQHNIRMRSLVKT